MPFLETAEAAETEGVASKMLYQYTPLIRYSLLLLGGVLVYFLMIRPLINTLKKDVTQHYKTVQQMEAEQARGAYSGAAGETITTDPLKKIKSEVQEDPVFSAHVLKSWIQDKG